MRGGGIACIGAAHRDHKARARAPVVLGSSNPVTLTTTAGGVARNVAETLARLGAPIALASIVGADAEGDALLNALDAVSVDTRSVIRAAGERTASYTALLDSDASLVVALADMAIYERMDAAWAAAVAKRMARRGIWVVDANLPEAALTALVRHAAQGVRILADPVSVAKAARLLPILPACHAIFPDRAEAAALTGIDVKTPHDGAAAAAALRKMGARAVIVTLGADGVWIDSPARSGHVPAPPVRRRRDVTGAGDALLAGYAFALWRGEEDTALGYGLATAAMTIESEESVNPAISLEAILARAGALTSS